MRCRGASLRTYFYSKYDWLKAAAKNFLTTSRAHELWWFFDSVGLLQAKSLYISRALSFFHETECKIWTGLLICEILDWNITFWGQNRIKRHIELLVALEPVCCKKQQKKSYWPVTGLWNRGPLKILNGIKLILDDQGNHLDSYNQFGIIQVLLCRGPLFRK